MTDWKRLRPILERAVELPAEARTGYLDEACAGDTALRQEADELLSAAFDQESFLELPAPETSLPAGTRIGSFRLTRVLGVGGMGTVYEAEQKDPKRRVALKMMRLGPRSAASRRRFRYEVEVLASLRHPGIAQVYETGEHEQRPWFAMEFVEDARTILQYAHDRDQTIEERIALFADVCDAVHHGHANGVIHRDLKPDNLLVGPGGHPKVIDFGVARAVDAEATMRTRAGEVVGTLAYMSPEQVGSDRSALDTRSDVYSLGVVLYELLTGELPYAADRSDFVAVMRAIHGAPPRRHPSFKGDLETIVRKCLEKEADRRYASASALGEDLRRYLSREPIVARPPSMLYSVAMLARRHKVAAASLALLLLVSVAAAAVSLVFAFRARAAERVAVARGEEAGKERDRARELFDTLMGRSMATTARFAPRLHDLPGGAPLTREMLEATLKDLQDLEQMAPDHPDVRRALAMAHVAIGDAEGNPHMPNVGNRDGALARYRRALEITKPLVEAHPDNEPVIYDHANVLGKLGSMALDDRDVERAGAYLEEVRTLLEAQCGRRPERENSWGSLASTYGQLGQLARLTQDWTAQRAHYRRQLEIFQGMLSRRPEETTRFYIGASHISLAGTYFRERDLPAAIAEYEAAATHLRPLVDAHPEQIGYRSKLAFCLFFAALCHGDLGNLVEGERLMRPARDLYARLASQGHRVPNQPDQEAATFQLARFNYDLANRAGIDAGERRKHLREALDLYRNTVELCDELQKRGPLPRQLVRIPAIARGRVEACEQALEAGG